MVNPLAIPVFKAGPDDSLAAVDVYKTEQQAGDVINSIQSILQGFDSTIGSLLSGFQSGDIKSIASAALGLAGANNPLSMGKELLDRAKNIAPQIQSAILGMDSSIKNILSSTLGSIGGGLNGVFGDAAGALNSILGSTPLGTGLFNINDSGNIYCNISDLISNIGVDKLPILQQLAPSINSITNKDTVTINDVGAQVGLYSGIIRECFNCDVSGVTKDIFSVIGDNSISSLVSKQVLPQIVEHSSVTDLNTLSSSLRVGELVNDTPDLLNIFTSNFGLSPRSSYNPVGLKLTDTTKIYADIIEAYTNTDPEWNICKRNTDSGVVTIPDISNITNGSKVFNTIITNGATQSTNDDDKIYLLAPYIEERSVEKMLKKQYRKTKFYFDLYVTDIVDPRAL